MAQAKVTAPAKPLLEVTVLVAVLPVVAPEVKLSAAGCDKVKPAPFTATAMTVFGSALVVVPLKLRVPTTVAEKLPVVPRLEATVTVAVAVPPAAMVTVAGLTEQVADVPPVPMVPLGSDVLHTRATVPA